MVKSEYFFVHEISDVILNLFTVHERDSVDGKKANSTYDGIYDTLKMKKTEGYESPFLGSKEPRKLAVDLKKLKIQEELGKTANVSL